MGGHGLDLALDIGMADEVVDGGVEIIRDFDERVDIRLDIVVFVFVYGLLTDRDNIGKLFLSDAVFRAKFL